MKIVLENPESRVQQQQQHQQETSEQQQFIIVQSQSIAGKAKIVGEEGTESQEEIVYVLKDENSIEQPNVIQLSDSNCVNQEQFVWITNNDQTNEAHQSSTAATTMYSIKEVNFSQVRNLVKRNSII